MKREKLANITQWVQTREKTDTTDESVENIHLLTVKNVGKTKFHTWEFFFQHVGI